MIAWLLGAASAATPLDADYTAPAWLADRHRPVPWLIDGFGVAGGHAPDGGRGAVEAGLIRRAVRWVADDGRVVPLLRDAMSTTLSAAWGDGRVGLGVSQPVWWSVTGAGWEGSQPRLGDPAIDGVVALLNPQRHPVGLAVHGRLGAALGEADRWVSRGGPFGEVGLGMERAWAPVALAGDLRWRVNPARDLDDALTLGDDLGVRLRASVPLGAHAAWAEISTDVPTRAPAQTAAELLIGGRIRLTDRTSLVVGGGAPVSAAIGLPAGRFLLGLRATPGSAADDRGVDADAGVAAPLLDEPRVETSLTDL